MDQMTETNSVVEYKLDVLEPDDTNDIEELTIQVRKYFCFKLSDSLLRNFRNSTGISNQNSAKENIQHIAQKKELEVFKKSKNIFEYKCSMIEQTFEFEKQAIDESIFFTLKLNNADFVKENHRWEPNFNIKHNLCDVAHNQSIKIKPIKIESKNPVTNKFRIHDTNIQSSKFIQNDSGETSNSVDCLKENNTDRRSQCLRIIDNVLLSKPINTKYPTLSLVMEKANFNSTRYSDNTDRIENLQNIENKVAYNHNSQEKNSYYITSEDYKLSGELLPQKRKKRFPCSPSKKRSRLENDIQLKPSDSHIWAKQALNMLKLSLKMFYNTSYIPNKDSYRIICRKIYTDILDKKIYEQEHINLYVEDAVKSKKYLQE